MAQAIQYEDDLDDSSVLDKEFFTEDEYFDVEDNSPSRWEFIPAEASGRGIIRAMSGGMPDHSAVAANLIIALGNALRARGNRLCRVFGSDLKVHTAYGRNTYPDVSVVCGALSLHRGRKHIVTNPTLIAEVLSPSTQKDDRGEKARSYLTIPSLQNYVILSVNKPQVELYTRQSDGWHLQTVSAESADAQVALPGLGVTLTIVDLYDLVEFDEEEQ